MSGDQALRAADVCPFCRRADVWLWDKGVPGRCAVACSNPDCAATGPIADTPTAAVISWNEAPRRARNFQTAEDGRTFDELRGAPR